MAADNLLFYGDNLTILREYAKDHLKAESVDLVELRRVMKPTASIYLHCDPTASHYLKMLMDAVFAPQNFLNEVVWKRTGAHGSSKRLGPVHDVLLFYAKGDSYTWHPQYLAQDE